MKHKLIREIPYSKEYEYQFYCANCGIYVLYIAKKVQKDLDIRGNCALKHESGVYEWV